MLRGLVANGMASTATSSSAGTISISFFISTSSDHPLSFFLPSLFLARLPALFKLLSCAIVSLPSALNFTTFTPFPMPISTNVFYHVFIALSNNSWILVKDLFFKSLGFYPVMFFR
ncbi:hypothetical protein Tco_0808735 [Tanacetum coccineum]